MAIAITLQEYLEWEDINFDVIEHPYTQSSMETAEAAHVPGDQLAKTVVLFDDYGYLMVVLPATHHVDLTKLNQRLDRDLQLASEQDFADLFYDCEEGAIPPLGEAYGFDVLVDESLSDCPDIYFEAGDHMDLIHVSGHDFAHLMTGVIQGDFSQHI